MNNTELVLSSEEAVKFEEFKSVHIECTTNETLATLYNVKLVFNISKNSVLPTCLCSTCGEEALLADRGRYEGPE